MTVSLLPLPIGSTWAVELPDTEGTQPQQTTTAVISDDASEEDLLLQEGDLGVLAVHYESFTAFVDAGGGGGMWSEGPIGTFTLTGSRCTMTSGDSVTIVNSEKVIINSGAIFDNNGILTNNGGIDIGGTLLNDGILTNNGIVSNWGSLINNGTFDITNGSSLANNSIGTLTNSTNGSLTNEGTLHNSGGLLYNDGMLTNNSTLTNTGSGQLYNRGTLTNSDIIENPGSLTNNADGTLILASASFTGTIANEGSVVLSTPGNERYLYESTIFGTGAVSKEGPGTFTLTGDNVYTGATKVNEGTLKLGGGAVPALFASGSITVDQDASLICDVPTSASLTYPGTLSGQGSFIKEGAGTLVLSGNNATGGTVQVSGGTLELSGDLTTVALEVGRGSALRNEALLFVDTSFESDGEIDNPGLIVSPAASTRGYTGANPLNTLIFDANGGTLSSPLALSTSFVIAEPNNSADFDKIFNKFARAGLTPTRDDLALLGWAEGQSSTTYVTFPYDFTNGSTLYAQWQADPEPGPEPEPGPNPEPEPGPNPEPRPAPKPVPVPATGDPSGVLFAVFGMVSLVAGLAVIRIGFMRRLRR